jgi:hypothetical protein
VSAISTIATGLDLHEARWGIGRDVDEALSIGPFGWFFVFAMFGLPIASLLALLRSRLALAPVAISASVFGLWTLYYATDWFANPGGGVWFPIFVLVLAGWAIVVRAAVRPRRDRRIRTR